MLFGLLMTLGVFVLSIALRSYQTSFAQKAGALGILTASFLAVYFITGSFAWGVVGALSWLFLPWLEILTRIRALRLPKEKRLRPKSPPSSDIFPSFDEISHEIESEGFAHISDAGWDWEDYRQFFRLYYKEEDRSQATICLERAARSFVLLSAHFLASQGRHYLDDVELPAFLRAKIDADFSDQSAAARSVVLAALPESSEIFATASHRSGSDRCPGRRSRADGSGERFTRADRAQHRERCPHANAKR